MGSQPIVHRKTSVVVATLVFALGAIGALARAQTAGSTEAASLATGRALLAGGDAERAAALGRNLLQQFPTSPAVLDFAVSTDIATRGAIAGLTTYERWAARTRTETPSALHQIARALLRETAGVASTSPSLRVIALRALADDGDAEATTALASDRSLSQAVAPLAAAGNDRAITELIAELQNPSAADRQRALRALGASRSPRAVTPILAMLRDPDPGTRAAAAEALGRLESPRAIEPLKALLTDQFLVHFQAAAALVQLGDPTGLAWLRSLESSEQDGIRLAVAQATRTRPDGAWLANVRGLTKSTEADIRRQAAELLAPHDPEAARGVLEPLLTDRNAAERDMATAVYVQTATEPGSLRPYLRIGEPAVRVKAASRILELTR